MLETQLSLPIVPHPGEQLLEIDVLGRDGVSQLGHQIFQLVLELVLFDEI